MAEPKYIIGQGQTLVTAIELNTGGGDKYQPYTFDQAAERLAPQVESALERIDDLPDEACPDDESVLALTLHPAFLAKSYHPRALFDAFELRQVGSRERRIVTAKNSSADGTGPEIEVPTSELFVAGLRGALRALDPAKVSAKNAGVREAFCRIETIEYPERRRLRVVPGDEPQIALEVVLHADLISGAKSRIDEGFKFWCDRFDGLAILKTLRRVDGLGFADVLIDPSVLTEFARFSFIRVIRRKPRLAFRALTARATPLAETFPITLPVGGPVPDAPRVAVFDGGLVADHPFGNWARAIDVPGLGPSVPEHCEHGTQVTSAALFGPLIEAKSPEAPLVPIDHYRVTDGTFDTEFALSEVLVRICDVLKSERYDAIGLSIGPDEAMIDDDINEWTTTMDTLAADGELLIVCAAGNNGDLDTSPELGLARVQPSADGVNVLGVGARDTLETPWERASYSAVGPGRSPGFVKPDVVGFGGESYDPFFAAVDSGNAKATVGTSFAAPTVLRLASGLRALFPELSMTAVRALLIHTADTSGHAQTEVGHGSVRHALDSLAVCAENEATVVYEGVLTDRRYIRCTLPVPNAGFNKGVELSATLVVVSPVDPQDSVSYTRAGASVIFRPDTVTDPGVNEKGRPKPPPSKSFFTSAKVFATEQELREDAHKWDTVMRARASFRATTLQRPVFDVEHQSRSNGGPAARGTNVPYVLIVSIRESGNSDLHASVLESHPTLVALEPVIELPAT